MRKMIVIGLLALAGCNEHQGWNPNYQLGGATPYQHYKQDRELVLMQGGAAPATIPITLPAQAPTPEQIRGGARMVVVARTYRADTAPARPVARPSDLPVAASGPYPGTTPVLVRYAAAARHEPGIAVWPRQGGSAATAARACASYSDAARAQIAFLAAGGPDRDPRGMDPDGDGFVCGWDPAPYRQDRL